MSLLVTASRFWLLALAAGALQACGGKVIALGDGTPGAGAGGSAGGGSVVTHAGMSGTGASGPGSGGASNGGTTPGGAGVLSAGGSAANGPGKGGANGGASMAGAGAQGCAHGEVAANEVLWIGDSWLTLPATGSNVMPPSSVQRQRVVEHAREALLVASDEDYVCSAAAAADMAAVAKQYADRQRIQPVKVLLMDGGTWDPIAAQLFGTSIDDAVATSIADFKQLLLDVAADGSVEHIVYFMVPPLGGIPRVDEMEPMFEDACKKSIVPCHFLDLGVVWTGHEDEYSAGIQASSAGAVALGDAIWKIMVDECIAQ
jgi:hypothetical protein